MNKSTVRALAAATWLLGASQSEFALAADVPADNTKSNQTDLSNLTATADAQGNSQADRTLTQRIRKSVMDE